MATDPLHLLQRARSIAVVGCSATPGKDAHEVPLFMHMAGYEVFPVNPSARAIFGRQAYGSLAEAPKPIDIVNVFRPSNEAPGIVRQAIETGARAVWLQTGLQNDEARRLAEDAGLEYVEDACIRVAAQMLAMR